MLPDEGRSCLSEIQEKALRCFNNNVQHYFFHVLRPLLNGEWIGQVQERKREKGINASVHAQVGEELAWTRVGPV